MFPSALTNSRMRGLSDGRTLGSAPEPARLSALGQKRTSSPRLKSTFVRCYSVVSTGRRNTGGQQAISNDDGLPNVRPIAFSDCPRNQPSHNTIFSAVLLPLRNH